MAMAARRKAAVAGEERLQSVNGLSREDASYD